MRKKHPARALSAVFVCFPLCGLCVNLCFFTQRAQRQPAGNVFQHTLYTSKLRPDWVHTQSAQRLLESILSAVFACFPLCGLCVNLCFFTQRAQRPPAGNVLLHTFYTSKLRPDWVSTQRAQRLLESILSAVFACFPLCGLCVNLLHGIVSRKARKDIWNLLSLRSLRVFLFAVSA